MLLSNPHCGVIYLDTEGKFDQTRFAEILGTLIHRSNHSSSPSELLRYAALNDVEVNAHFHAFSTVDC